MERVFHFTKDKLRKEVRETDPRHCQKWETEMQRQGIKLPGIASSSSSCPLVCDWGSGRRWICSRLFMAAGNPIGRPQEKILCALWAVILWLRNRGRRKLPNVGVSAELLVLSIQAVEQGSAAGVCCRYVCVQLMGEAFAGTLCCRFRSRIGVLMNQQWLKNKHFVEFLLSSNYGKESLKILEKPGGTPSFPRRE